MRKAFIILIAVILTLGAAGCGSAPSSYDAFTMVNIANACNIANAINANNMLHPDSMVPDNSTPQQAKEITDESLWPIGLTDEDAAAAWQWLVIRNGKADLTPEAQELWDKGI